MIENGKPIGVVLTIEEYELLQSKSQIPNPKSQTSEVNLETEQLLTSKINNEPVVNPINPIGEAIAKEIDFPEISADLADINIADDISDVTLEDLGLDPDIQLPADF